MQTDTPHELIICTDLDGTLLPNRGAAEHPKARQLFREACAKHHTVLVYVTGRSKALIEEAIIEFDLDYPHYAVADVGTTIYKLQAPIAPSTEYRWQQIDEWHVIISKDWQGHTSEQLRQFLPDQFGLRLQDESNQKPYKLSYVTKHTDELDVYVDNIRKALAENNIAANVIGSINEIAHDGLIDIIPASADKLAAIEFLHQNETWTEDNIIFSGDSGNDLSVLCSGYQSVLVANATDDIKQAAVNGSLHNKDKLYIAKGIDDILNGNYCAGIMEGVHHFIPALNFINGPHTGIMSEKRQDHE